MITAAAVLGGAAVGSNLLTGYLNYKNQQDTLAWQKDVQRDIFAREDTSIARRVANFKSIWTKSGISRRPGSWYRWYSICYTSPT